MLRIYLFLIYSLLFLNILGNERNEYLDPYKRICADTTFSNKAIKVSSYLIDLDRFYFKNNDGLTQDEQEKVSNHRIKNSFKWKDPIYEPKLDSLQKNTVIRPEYIVYFSPLEDNMIVACVAKYINSEFYEKNVRFYKVTEFLFILDSNKKIVKQYKTYVIID